MIQQIVYNNNNRWPTKRAQMKWEVKGAKEVANKKTNQTGNSSARLVWGVIGIIVAFGVRQRLPTTFTKLHKSVEKGCIMMLER